MIRSSTDKISEEEEVQQEENESHEITREKVTESCIIVSSAVDDIIVVPEDKDDIVVTEDNDLVLSTSSRSRETQDADDGMENRIIGGIGSAFTRWIPHDEGISSDGSSSSSISSARSGNRPLNHIGRNTYHHTNISSLGVDDILITEDQIEITDRSNEEIIEVQGHVIDSNRCGCFYSFSGVRNYKRKSIFSVFLVLLVGVFVFFVSKPNWFLDERIDYVSEQHPTTKNNNTEENSQQIIEESDTLVYLRAMILYNITDYSLLYDRESPHYQSLKWLADEDEILLQTSTQQDNSTKSRISLFLSLSPNQYKMLLQRYAMTLFYFSTNGEKWFEKGNFLNPRKHVCDWGFYSPEHPEFSFTNIMTHQNVIGCTTPSRKIQTLLFRVNRLEGNLLSINEFVSTGIHESLSWLEVDGNSLQGTIPDAFQHLKMLNTVRFNTNFLSGEIPYFGNMQNSLEIFTMSHNSFNGSITRENSGLDKLQKLRVLHLSHNRFSGEIPSTLFAELTPVLQNLQLEGNNFWGNMSSICLTSDHYNNSVKDYDNSSPDVPGILYADCLEKIQCSCCSKCF